MAPVYEYECSWGHRYELQQPMSADTVHECLHCPIIDNSEARRVPSLFNANVDAVITGKDVRATPKMRDYLGHRRWRAREDKRLADAKAAVNPITSYRTGPGHGMDKKAE